MRRVKRRFSASSSHFGRTDIETVIHSDSGFATVSYLRIKGAILEEKPELRDDLTIPPLLEADFVRIQSLIRAHHSTDIPIHAVHKSVTCRPAAPPDGLSSSRRGDWVAVGNVHSVRCQATTFEEEIMGCFHELQGRFTCINEALC